MRYVMTDVPTPTDVEQYKALHNQLNLPEEDERIRNHPLFKLIKKGTGFSLCLFETKNS